MPRPREYDDDLRARLVDAAGRLLADEGPHALSTRRVAREVGTSTAAIYSLLGSKDDLVRAVWVEGFARLASALAAVPPHPDPCEHIVALSRAYLDNALANPHLYRVMFERPVAEVAPTDDEVRFSLSTLGVLVDAVARAASEGRLPDDAEGVAIELWALVHGIATIALWGMAGPAEQTRGHLDRMARAQLAGYASLVESP